MLNHGSPKRYAVASPLTYQEIKTISKNTMEVLFSENDRVLINFAEDDPALRSFLDRMFGLDTDEDEIPGQEEFEKFSYSDQEALWQAIEHRMRVHDRLVVTLGALGGVPPFWFSVH